MPVTPFAVNVVVADEHIGLDADVAEVIPAGIQLLPFSDAPIVEGFPLATKSISVVNAIAVPAFNVELPVASLRSDVEFT